jgi:cytochrome c556
MEKAVQWQRDGDAAAKELAAAAKSENADAVRSAMGKLGGSCKQCHEAHREKVSEGVYRIKK